MLNSKRKNKTFYYTPEVDTPVPISKMCKIDKYEYFVKKIDALETSEEMKAFLRVAAMRFIRLDFLKIADFYAQQDEKIQKLMEKLVLVTIDDDERLYKSYRTLCEDIDEVVKRQIFEDYVEKVESDGE